MAKCQLDDPKDQLIFVMWISEFWDGIFVPLMVDPGPSIWFFMVHW
jgi:hypothetical protein